MSQKTKDDYLNAMVELTNALEEWKSAGADPLTVVRAVQGFVYALMAAREEAMKP